MRKRRLSSESEDFWLEYRTQKSKSDHEVSTSASLWVVAFIMLVCVLWVVFPKFTLSFLSFLWTFFAHPPKILLFHWSMNKENFDIATVVINRTENSKLFFWFESTFFDYWKKKKQRPQSFKFDAKTCKKRFRSRLNEWVSVQKKRFFFLHTSNRNTKWLFNNLSPCLNTFEKTREFFLGHLFFSKNFCFNVFLESSQEKEEDKTQACYHRNGKFLNVSIF